MWEVKISYNKVWKEDGTVYRTCVNMNRELFNKFLIYLKDLCNIELSNNNNWSKLWNIETDIKDYSTVNIMFLRQTTTKALNDFLKLYSLNTNNRGLIDNTFIKIV